MDAQAPPHPAQNHWGTSRDWSASSAVDSWNSPALSPLSCPLLRRARRPQHTAAPVLRRHILCQFSVLHSVGGRWKPSDQSHHGHQQQRPGLPRPSRCRNGDALPAIRRRALHAAEGFCCWGRYQEERVGKHSNLQNEIENITFCDSGICISGAEARRSIAHERIAGGRQRMQPGAALRHGGRRIQ